MKNDDNVKKIKLLKLYELLSQETDEEHPLGTVAIIKKLNEMGISCTRKTLYSDIATLNAFGYEVMCVRAVSNMYYVTDRKFDVSELRILLDAVQAASFITDKKTDELVDKIANLAGSRSGEVLKNNVVEFNTTKNTNESIFYNVSAITEAISNGKKLTFKYFEYDLDHNRQYRKGGDDYVVNPFATILSSDNYYLLAYDDKRGKMVPYRVDRMDKVQVSQLNILPVPISAEIDVSQHKKQVFDMFLGQSERVEFLVENKLKDAVFDRFGSEIKLYKHDDQRFTFSADVQLSDAFFGWCCSFGDMVEVISPQKVRSRVKGYAEKILLRYDK